MSKADTDQGLGPGSERQRREVLEAQKKLDARAQQKDAGITPSPPPSKPVVVDKTAVTEPGIGKVERRSDTVDDLLDGFGTERPNLPRILPNADTTPPPEPVKKELTPTAPGARQRTRNMVLATIVTFAVVAAVGVALVKFGSNGSTATPTSTTTTATTATTTTTTTATTTETMTPITTTAIESLPTVKTAAPQTTATAPATARTVHSATTATATQTAPHPTGSAPPGMNLLPDDPHR